MVRRFLQALPRVGLGGESLRYRAQPGGGFLLYSVGLDGHDDGGDPFPGNPENQSRAMEDGRDMVWPSAATEWQAEAAMNPR